MKVCERIPTVKCADHEKLLPDAETAVDVEVVNRRHKVQGKRRDLCNQCGRRAAETKAFATAESKMRKFERNVLKLIRNKDFLFSHSCAQFCLLVFSGKRH